MKTSRTLAVIMYIGNFQKKFNGRYPDLTDGNKKIQEQMWKMECERMYFL